MALSCVLPLVTGAPISIISDFSTLMKSARGDDDAIAVKSSIIISHLAVLRWRPVLVSPHWLVELCRHPLPQYSSLQTEWRRPWNQVWLQTGDHTEADESPRRTEVTPCRGSSCWAPSLERIWWSPKAKTGSHELNTVSLWITPTTAKRIVADCWMHKFIITNAD